MKFCSVAFAVAAAVALAAPGFLSAAHADTFYNFDYKFTTGTEFGTGGSNYSGVLDVSGGTVVGITGTSSALGSITGLLPGDAFAFNDNLFSPTSPFVTLFGFSFSLSSGANGNIYYQDGEWREYNHSLSSGSHGILTISEAAAVPGPVVGAGLPGMIFAGGALLAWRRKQKAAAFAA